jgi:YVTN family beta-propeller protein
VPLIRPTILALCLGFPASAVAADAGIYLYLQPLPPEAATLTFVITSMSAVSSGGSEVPLDVNLKSIGSAETRRQRLLAAGRIPAGSYTGFLFRVKQAALKNELGETTLAVPDEPVRLDFPFAVAGQQASLFWLSLRYQESVTAASGFSPVFSVVVPSKPIVGHAGFVSNGGSNTITVFDKQLGQAVAAIDTCAGPAGMALDQYRRRLFVACSKDNEIVSIDVATGEIVERTRLSPGDRPQEVALTPDGRVLLSVNAGSGSVSFFGAASLVKQERIAVGNGPNSVAIDPSGARAFVFNTLSDTVSIIDIAGRTLVTTLSADPAPLRGQFSGRGDRLYVIHEQTPYLTVLDPRQLAFVTRARLRTRAGAIELDRVRGLVCLGGSQNSSVEFYDPNALLPLYTLRTRAGVSHLKIDVEDNSLYMVSPETRSLIVGRLADRRIGAEIDVGSRPYWVAVMGEK